MAESCRGPEDSRSSVESDIRGRACGKRLEFCRGWSLDATSSCRACHRADRVEEKRFRLEEDVAISLATVSVTRVGFGIVRSERRDEESDTIELEDPTRLIDARR